MNQIDSNDNLESLPDLSDEGEAEEVKLLFSEKRTSQGINP